MGQYKINIECTNCTANKQSGFYSVDEDLTINFIANDGYKFNSKPVAYYSIDTIYGEIDDSTHSHITFSGISENDVWDVMVDAIVDDTAKRIYIDLDLTNCECDVESGWFTLLENNVLLINFTSNKGFIFKYAPTIRIGIDSWEGELIDDTHCKVELKYNEVSKNDRVEIVTSAESIPKIKDSFPFINVYVPTKEQLIESAKSLVIGNNSVIELNDYIISIHKVYVDVDVNEELETIYYGNIDSKVASKTLMSRNVIVDCGNIFIKEIYNNGLDYEPYTTAKLWIPFIGFQNININDIMNKTVGIKYNIDVLTGQALVELYIKTNDSEIVFDSYTGTAYNPEPYFVNTQANSSKSLINNIYNMGSKIPYLIINRPIDITPIDNNYNSKQSYEMGKLIDNEGFVRCASINTNNIQATETEKDLIKEILETGIFI